MLVTHPFIHGLSCLSKRLTDPMLVFNILSAMQMGLFSVEWL
jgi:hypothetical protein